MRIEVCVPNAAQFAVAQSVFGAHPDFTVERKSITDASHQCIATAGNSFGGMSGGVDGIVNTHLSAFTPEGYVQARVKRAIEASHLGELPVGQAVHVMTDHPRHRVLIYAPTMRVPEPLPADTLAPYLAFRAVLLDALRIEADGVSVPLFGTGAGEVPVRRACMQMLEARRSLDAQPQLTRGDNELATMGPRHRALVALC